MRSRPVAIKDVLERIIQKLKSGKISKAESLNSSWAKAIGEDNVRHAKPVEVKGKTLIVCVDSSSWLHKLSMEKARLLMQLKGDLGEDVVDDIKLKIGVF